MIDWLYLILSGVVSGILGGMGMGGGTLLIPILTIFLNFAQKNAIVERYFYDKESKEICDINGNPFSQK